jgi:hypothetical protein
MLLSPARITIKTRRHPAGLALWRRLHQAHQHVLKGKRVPHHMNKRQKFKLVGALPSYHSLAHWKQKGVLVNCQGVDKTPPHITYKFIVADPPCFLSPGRMRDCHRAGYVWIYAARGIVAFFSPSRLAGQSSIIEHVVDLSRWQCILVIANVRGSSLTVPLFCSQYDNNMRAFQCFVSFSWQGYPWHLVG